MKQLTILIMTLCPVFITTGQTTIDQTEIAILNKLIYHSGTTDAEMHYDFSGKKIAFFSCAHDPDSDGFLTDEEFFGFALPEYNGPRGLFVLNENQKNTTGGWDAIVMINCKAYSEEELLNLLKKHNN